LIHWLGLQNDGRWIVAGFFDFVSPPATFGWSGIARFYTNGTGDYIHIAPTGDGFRGFMNDGVNAIRSGAFQADGKIVLGGSFSILLTRNLGSTVYTRIRLGRMDKLGYVDETFTPSANNT